MYSKRLLFLMCIGSLFIGCKISRQTDAMFTLMTLDPGHFHAALVQKTMYPQVSPQVYVYAPDGDELNEHLRRIESYNTRPENPTHWQEIVYRGDDYLQKLLQEKPGNVLVTAGNNRRKAEYIKAAVEAGIHVLADKPLCIDAQGFELIKEAFAAAEKNGVLLYDIMTERYEITTILQKRLSGMPDVFGELLTGTPDEPAITKESVHHFFKYVSGAPLKRPAWFFDTTQQGEGIVDVTTHLIDLIQWECFPEQILDYRSDVEILRARRWPTILTPAQFKQVTHLDDYPDYLKPYVRDGNLVVFSNGEIVYRLKNIHAKVSVLWNFQAPEGGGDTHFSIMRGSKADLIIRQGKEENYRPELYVRPNANALTAEFEKALQAAIEKLASEYPGLALERGNSEWRVLVPDKYRVGHEAHFAQVMEKFLGYLQAGKLPDWEVPNMIAKYYTTTAALQKALAEN